MMKKRKRFKRLMFSTLLLFSILLSSGFCLAANFVEKQAIEESLSVHIPSNRALIAQFSEREAKSWESPEIGEPLLIYNAKTFVPIYYEVPILDSRNNDIVGYYLVDLDGEILGFRTDYPFSTFPPTSQNEAISTVSNKLALPQARAGEAKCIFAYNRHFWAIPLIDSNSTHLVFYVDMITRDVKNQSEFEYFLSSWESLRKVPKPEFKDDNQQPRTLPRYPETPPIPPSKGQSYYCLAKNTVPYFGQYTDKWCWNASFLMVYGYNSAGWIPTSCTNIRDKQIEVANNMENYEYFPFLHYEVINPFASPNCEPPTGVCGFSCQWNAGCSNGLTWGGPGGIWGGATKCLDDLARDHYSIPYAVSYTIPGDWTEDQIKTLFGGMLKMVFPFWYIFIKSL